MELSIEKRREVYKMAYKLLLYKRKSYCCTAIKKAAEIILGYWPNELKKEDFPEFYLFKPRRKLDEYDVWFKRDQQRFIVLSFCIAMCE